MRLDSEEFSRPRELIRRLSAAEMEKILRELGEERWRGPDRQSDWCGSVGVKPLRTTGIWCRSFRGRSLRTAPASIRPPDLQALRIA